MYLRNGVWNYDFIMGGKRYRGSTGFTEHEKKKAEREVARLKVEAREGYSVQLTWQQAKRRMMAANDVHIPDLYEAFHKLDTGTRSKGREDNIKRKIGEFTDWMQQNHPDVVNLGDVTDIHAAEFCAWLRDIPGANATKNETVRVLKSAFALIGEKGGIVENPFASVKKMTTSHETREAFTPEELKLIGEKTTGWMYSLFLTAVSTGLREGDICMLRKECVDLDAGWLSLKTRKTGTPVEIPILPGLKKHLANAIAESENEYVFPELANRYTHSRGNLSNEITAYLRSIGIETQRKVEGYKRLVSVKDCHSFRHTFVYLAAVHGIPFPIVQGIVGHASAEMTKHYMDHARREEKAAYMMRLPDYLSGELETKTPPPQIETEELEEDRKELIELVKTIPLSQVRRILDQLL